MAAFGNISHITFRQFRNITLSPKNTAVHILWYGYHCGIEMNFRRIPSFQFIFILQKIKHLVTKFSKQCCILELNKPQLMSLSIVSRTWFLQRGLLSFRPRSPANMTSGFQSKIKFNQVMFNSLVFTWERNFEVTFGIFSVLVA